MTAHGLLIAALFLLGQLPPPPPAFGAPPTVSPPVPPPVAAPDAVGPAANPSPVPEQPKKGRITWGRKLYMTYPAPAAGAETLPIGEDQEVKSVLRPGREEPRMRFRLTPAFALYPSSPGIEPTVQLEFSNKHLLIISGEYAVGSGAGIGGLGIGYGYELELVKHIVRLELGATAGMHPYDFGANDGVLFVMLRPTLYAGYEHVFFSLGPRLGLGAGVAFGMVFGVTFRI